jgi:tetratricopeptide (TPR) repeat protein
MGRYQLAKQQPAEATVEPIVERPATPRARLTWTAAAFLLGALVLGLRLAGSASPGRMVDNRALLRAAMGADSAVPQPAGTPTGFQARALSRIAQTAGQPATAETWLAHGLTDPASAYLAQFELCRLYWNAGRQAQAREACRDTLDSATYWLSRGYVADQSGDIEGALAYYQMAAATDGELTAAWHQIGRALFALGRYEEAIPAFERLMVLDATPTADVYDALSLSYLELDNPTMARDVLDRGLLFYPDQRVYYLAMADSYRREDNLEAAEGWYARMLQRWPHDAQAWAARGDTAVAGGRLRDAIDYYRQAAANQPEGVGYWINLASTAVAAEDFPLATQAYRRAMELRPDDPAVWLHAGRFLVESGQVDEARAVFEHILVLQPDNDEAATQLAALAAPSGQ